MYQDWIIWFNVFQYYFIWPFCSIIHLN